MAITSYRIREELQDPLEQAATKLRRPKAWIINEALAACFERENQDQRMYRETLEGLADVEAGRIIDGDQVVAWISTGEDHRYLRRHGGLHGRFQIVDGHLLPN